MRKPLPCKSCIAFPLCRPIYMSRRPIMQTLTIDGHELTYKDTRFLRPLTDRCSILKHYFNWYLNFETFHYRKGLLIDYYETPIEESE